MNTEFGTPFFARRGLGRRAKRGSKFAGIHSIPHLLLSQALAKFLFEHLRLHSILKMERRRLREVVQNILDEPIPEKVKQRLLKPLRPSKGGKPIAPPRRENAARRRALLVEFDPYLPHGNQTITNYQNELLRLYDALEGVAKRSKETGNSYFDFKLC